MAQRVCIVGGGATGVALLWLLAKAQHRHPTARYEITLVHDVLVTDQNGQPQHGVPSLGGHSRSVSVEVNGTEYWIDLGVQMIAPAMYPNLMCMLKLPEFSGVQMDPVPLRVSCAFPPDAPGGPARYWGNFPSYQTTPLYQQGAGDAGIFESVLKNQPLLPTSLQVLLDAQKTRFSNYTAFETYFLDPYLSIMNGYGAALLDQIYVPEAAFLFNNNYASFTSWSSDFMRFHYGAMQWVQTMAQDAVDLMPNGSVNDCHWRFGYRCVSRTQRTLGRMGCRGETQGPAKIRHRCSDYGYGHERRAARTPEQSTLELLPALRRSRRLGSRSGLLLSAPGLFDRRARSCRARPRRLFSSRLTGRRRSFPST